MSGEFLLSLFQMDKMKPREVNGKRPNIALVRNVNFCLTLPYPPQQYKDILLYLHVIFIFLIFIFSSLKHLEFIFAYGMKQGSSYFIF